jgi:hypothetical protein
MRLDLHVRGVGGRGSANQSASAGLARAKWWPGDCEGVDRELA